VDSEVAAAIAVKEEEQHSSSIVVLIPPSLVGSNTVAVAAAAGVEAVVAEVGDRHNRLADEVTMAVFDCTARGFHMSVVDVEVGLDDLREAGMIVWDRTVVGIEGGTAEVEGIVVSVEEIFVPREVRKPVSVDQDQVEDVEDVEDLHTAVAAEAVPSDLKAPQEEDPRAAVVFPQQVSPPPPPSSSHTSPHTFSSPHRSHSHMD